MRTALIRKSGPTPRAAAAPVAGVALLGLLALTACGGRTDSFQPGDPGSPAPTPSVTSDASAGTDSTAAAGTTSTTGTTAATTTPPPILYTLPPDVPGGGTELTGPTTVTETPPAPSIPASPPRATPAQKRAAINATYDTFLVDLTGLLRTFSPAWQTALSQVATPDMTLAITRSAVSIQNSKSHTVGALHDAPPTRAITIKGDEALLKSCLDERSWYAVKDQTQKPDIGIARGYFIGRATFVYVKGRWLVNTWNSLPQRCKFTS